MMQFMENNINLYLKHDTCLQGSRLSFEPRKWPGIQPEHVGPVVLSIQLMQYASERGPSFCKRLVLGSFKILKASNGSESYFSTHTWACPLQ